MRGRDFVAWGVALLLLVWFVRTGGLHPDAGPQPAHTVSVTPSTYGPPGPAGGVR